MDRDQMQNLEKNGYAVSMDLKRMMEESQQQHDDLLVALRDNDWPLKEKEHFTLLSTELGRSNELQKETLFCQMLFARLRFPFMHERHERISKAHRETFQWIYDDLTTADAQWTNFVSWLESSTDGENIYWITGKAGSGKSTLMKFLWNDRRTAHHLGTWAGDRPLVRAGFFFWISGANMQMPGMGLLQTLLVQLLEDRPGLLSKLFRERWESYNYLHGGLENWTWHELKQAFEILVSDRSRNYFFLIDGLDEFHGDPEELIDFIINTAKSPNVKICIASRPWLIFEEAFNDRPSLMLQQLTRPDIQRYVSAKFRENKRYLRLVEQDVEYATRLADSVVEKSPGVFLWVYLVVKSLLQGITNSDRISDLQNRLDSLPSDLEALFDRLLNIGDAYFSEACQMFQIVRAAQEPLDLLTFSFADGADSAVVPAAVSANIRQMNDQEILARLDDDRRRLNTRCKGLIEASATGTRPGRVEYLHRSAKDFLESKRVWEKIVDGTGRSFNPNRCLCAAFLYRLKLSHQGNASRRDLWDAISWVMEYSMQAEKVTRVPEVAVLDELHQTATVLIKGTDSAFSQWTLASQQEKVPTWAAIDPCDYPLHSFLEVAVRFNLLSYVKNSLERNTTPWSRGEYDRLLWLASTSTGMPACAQGKAALMETKVPSTDMIRLLLAQGAYSSWFLEDIRGASRSSLAPGVQPLLLSASRAGERKSLRLRFRSLFRRSK
jgi:hypothetical protein